MQIHSLLMRYWCVPLCLVVLVAASASLPAQPLQAQPDAAADSGMPFLTLGPQGQVFLAWTEPSRPGTHALRYSQWAANRWLPTQTAAEGAKWFVNWADFASIAVDSTGQLYAHWLARAPEGGKYGYGIRIGQRNAGTWREVHSMSRDEKEDYAGFLTFVRLRQGMGAAYLSPPLAPKTAASTAHTNHTSHQDHDHRKTLRLLELTASGKVHRDTLLDEDVCSCCQTAALETPDSIWVAYRDHREGEIRDISIVDVRNGVPGKPRILHPDGWQINGCPTDGPSMDRDATHAAAVWFTRGGGAKVQAAFSTLREPAFSAPVRVDDGNPLGRATIRSAGQGRFLVLWLERLSEGHAALRVRALRADGTRGPATSVATLSAAWSTGFPQLLIAGSEVFLAWRETGIQIRRMPVLAFIPKEWK